MSTTEGTAGDLLRSEANKNAKTKWCVQVDVESLITQQRIILTFLLLNQVMLSLNSGHFDFHKETKQPASHSATNSPRENGKSSSGLDQHFT